MTTKIFTVRLPVPLYSDLCASAAELGVPVAAHVRRLIEREHQAEQVALLRTEMVTRLDKIALAKTLAISSNASIDEILLLNRAIASHLSPQMVSQVRATLALPSTNSICAK